MASSDDDEEVEGDGSDRPAEASDQHPDPGAVTYHFSGGTLSIAGGGSEPADGTDEGSVEHVEEDIPILAHRAALLLPARGGPAFSAMSSRLAFGVDAVARCLNYHSGGFVPVVRRGFHFTIERRHSAPDLGCTCGFYAVPLAEALPYDEATLCIDLLVELSGRVIEHEHGYRAEHQRIVEARIPGCGMCGAPSDVLKLRHCSTRCAKHLPTNLRKWLNRDDLARLPVPVTYLELAS